jgi:molecular chaperone HscB
MSNVVGMNEYVGLASGNSYCWLCQKPVSIRALFCPICGTIQPVRDIDHFARLGVECRLDVDMELLERQYTTLSCMLAPERFLIRGIGERGHASRQLEALKEAYETLREPLRRGRYWLQLNEKEQEEDVNANPLVSELRQELTDAAEPSHCDRIAQRAGQALEQGVMLLMQALRGGNWREANKTLSQIDGVETILNEVRERRSGMTHSRD